jgi:hypothetical protein
MKKLILILIMALPIFASAQLTTINPDTVCIGTAGSIYEVPATTGYTYNWTITPPGIQTGGGTTNSITADWSAAVPGLIVGGVTVTATDANGCTSLPVTLDVFIYEVIPTITPIGPFCEDEPCVALTGTPIGGAFSGTGVVGGTFCPTTAGPGIHTITYTYISNGCTFTVTYDVTVNATPVLTPIQHN